LHVVLAADETYAKQLAVALRSLSDAAGDTEYCAFVLQSGFDTKLRARVEASGNGNVEIRWLDVPEQFVGGVQRSARVPPTSAYRILTPTLLPTGPSRVVYLDCDVIVRNPLDALWSMDLGGAPVAAVRDAYLPVACRDIPWRRAGIDPSAAYFNAGVLVIELDRWRASDVATRGIALLRELKLRYFDQSAVNILFANEWRALPPEWNLQTHHLSERSRAWAFEDREALEAAIADPAIVHLSGTDRPWDVGSVHPYRDEWFATLDRTAWSGWRPRRRWVAGASRRVWRAGAELLGRRSK
jgi:lipopolysaccharide biosynthesis glycosyltransferase